MELTIDFETYWDKDYTLTKMDAEAYILDRRFEMQGCAVKIDNDPTEFLTHAELKRFLAGLPFPAVTVISHNSLFDAAILAWRYNVISDCYIDTLGLANAFIRPFTGRSRLDTCAEYLGLPLKSSILTKTKGMRLSDIVYSGYYDQFAAYCKQDADNCRFIRDKFYDELSFTDKTILHWTIRNYVKTKAVINANLLTDIVRRLEDERAQLLAEAGLTDPAVVRSTKKFAAYLESLGVDVEYKEGTDGEIPAVSRKDPFVADLLKHSDPIVVAAIKGRLAYSSNNELTRAKRLLRMAATTGGRMLAPMVYHAAHTGRPGGASKANLNNFTKRPKTAAPDEYYVREAIQPKKGHVFVDVDSSQIECRIMAWLANCRPLHYAFAEKRDPYCEYATNVLYHRPITKADYFERQIAKVEVLALQYGVGHVKLRKQLELANVPIDEATAEQHVQLYRTAYPEILGFGRDICNRIKYALRSGKVEVARGFVINPDYGVYLPSGRWLVYPKLHITQDGQLLYWAGRYLKKLYPGAINENICQALANAIVGSVLARFHRDTFAWVYDSIVRVVPEDMAEQAAAETVEAMREVPPWAMGLVTDAEAKIKRSF